MPKARQPSHVQNETHITTFEGIYYHERTHQVLICRLCEYAILPSSIGPHIKKHHKSLYKKTGIFGAIVAYSDTLLPDLCTSTAEVIIPRTTVPPYPFLQIHKGFMCKLVRTCEKIFTGYNAVHNIETHQLVHHSKEVEADDEEHRHEWIKKKGKGRPTKEETQLIAQRRSRRMRSVLAQRFFHTSHNHGAAERGASSFFEITPPEDYNYVSNTKQDDARKLDELLTLGREQRGAQVETAGRTIPEQESNQANPLLEATGWQPILANMDFVHVESLSRPPSTKDGPLAKAIWDAVKTMMRAWQYNTELFGTAIRTAVCHERSARPPSSTFTPYKDHDTKHASTLQHLFMFFYRTYDQPGDFPYPKYTFSKSQEHAWEELIAWLSDAALSRQDRLPEIHKELERDPKRATLHDLEQLCHNFWLSLVQQEVKKSEWELTLVNALSTRAITSSGYKHAGTLATDLSEMKKMARFALLQELSHEFPNDDDYPTSEEEEGVQVTSILDKIDKSQTTSPTPLSTIQTWTRRYLNIESHNAIGWVITTGIEIREIQRDADAEGFVQWDGNRLTCHDTTIDTDEWKAMVLGHYKDTSSKLLQLLYVEEEYQVPSIPWPLIRDRPGVIHYGYHIFQQDENPALSNQETFITDQMQRLLTSKSIPQKWRPTVFISDPQKRLECIRQYADDVHDFGIALAALIHLTYGQQARGTELLSIRFMNTHNHGLRNIFLVNGLIAIVPRWHKSYTQTKRPKIVWRFLPRAVGNLLFWYIWLVLPHLQSLQELVPESDRGVGYQRAYSEFLFPSVQGTSYGGDASVLTKRLASITHAALGEGLSLRPIRQMTVAMGRKDGGNSGDFMILDEFDMQRANETADADAIELQSGHEVTTGHLAYANLIGQFSSRLRDRHWKGSTRWHRYLGFPLTEEQLEALGPIEPSEKNTTGQITPVQSARVDRALALATVDHQNLLVKMFGPGSTFKGLQRSLMAVLFTDKSPVVYVAGTGSGKSLAFLLPATCPAFGLQIVVVPLIGLRLDILHRCTELGIHCVEWSPGVRADHARIVLIMPEQLDTHGFGMFIEALRKIARIGRIVIDEAHYILLTSPEFRQTMSKLSELVRREVPIVALTATLPPEEEAELFERLSFPENSVSLFREPTSRPNIGYQVERIKKRFGIQEIADHIELCKRHSGHKKVVAFVPYQNMVTDVALILGCSSFHGGMDDLKRRGSLKEFMEKEEATMIATSALGHGLHDPHIGLVLHYGAPEGLKQYSQESGRAGRGGQPATAIVVLPEGFPTWLEKATLAEIHRVRRFLNMDGHCRRRALDAYLDGRHDRERCLDHEAQCDACKANYAIDPRILEASTIAPSYVIDEMQMLNDTDNSEESADEGTEAEISTTGHKRRRIERVPNPGSPESEGEMRASMSVRVRTRPQTASHSSLSPQMSVTPWTTTASMHTENSSGVAAEIPNPKSITREEAVQQSVVQHAQAMAEARETSTNKSKAAAVFLTKRIPVALGWWEFRCLSCYIQGLTYDHTVCVDDYSAAVMPVIRCLVLPKFKHCFQCLLPQNVCNRIQKTQRADNARNGVIIRSKECRFGLLAKNLWGAVYAKSLEEKTFLVSLMHQHGKKGGSSDSTVGSTDFKAYYSSEVELSANIVIPTLLRDIVLLIEERFLPRE